MKVFFRIGASISKEDSDGKEDGLGRLHDIHGVLCEEHQSKSLNKRELRNLVDVVDEELEAGMMGGLELFFLTNNYVAEAVYYWGNSRKNDIFELIIG